MNHDRYMQLKEYADDYRDRGPETVECEVECDFPGIGVVTASASGTVIDESDYQGIEGVKLSDFWVYDDDNRRIGVTLTMDQLETLESKAEARLSDLAAKAVHP